MASILLSLTDKSVLAITSYHLERCGFVVNAQSRTEEIFPAIDRMDPSVIIIDEDMPGNFKVSDICSGVRIKARTKNIKIILVSRHKADNNKNIDDYLPKPFVVSELINKVKSFIDPYKKNSDNILTYNGIEMNVSSFRVSRSGRVIHLGPTEFKILQCFLELPEKVLSREHIMSHVWGSNSLVEQRTIDVHINRLRLALKENTDKDYLIRTIRSAGYALSIL